jgi:hypothetical protein
VNSHYRRAKGADAAAPPLRGEARQKIAWRTAEANKLKWKVYLFVWAVFEPKIVSHGALSLDLPGAYSKI